MKYKLILHPYLLTLYAVLVPLANNIAEVKLAGLRALVVSLVVSIFLVIIARLVLKDAVKAGLVSSGFIFFIFSYGHFEMIAREWSVGGFTFGQPAIMVPIWGVLLGGWLFGVLKKWHNLSRLSGYLNWVSVILLVFPVYQIGLYTRQSTVVKPWIQSYLSQVWQENGVDNVYVSKESDQNHRMPDIYYIILDGYTNAATLAELYQYDNSDFIQALQERGFYVAEDSRSNYTATWLSLSSSLNMSQINTAPEYFHQNARADGEWILQSMSRTLMDENKVSAILRDLGYSTVVFESGYEGTRIRGADQTISSPAIEGASSKDIIFEMMLLDTSLGRIYMRLKGGEFTPLQNLFKAHRQRVLFELENLPGFANKEGNYFVFAHIITPHTPYVFGPNGEEIVGVDPYTLLDAQPGQKENIHLYRDQVHYINKLVLKTIDQILTQSEVQPIIILQGDHSSRVYSELNPPLDTKMKLLFPILNAYYLPGEGNKLLYPTISPVNSFRVIFNYYFGAHLSYFDDNSYELIKIKGRQEFIDVCQTYTYCSP